jgi:uncharacterized protein YcbK (DUF882 family)
MNLNFKLTKNFKLSEFLISDFFDEKSQSKVLKEFKDDINLHFNIQKLACNLQILRDELKVPIKINIAYRPVFWELKQKRSGNSKHTLAIAADIVVEGYNPDVVAETIESLIIEGKLLEGGIGVYNTFTHYDIRETKARWK